MAVTRRPDAPRGAGGTSSDATRRFVAAFPIFEAKLLPPQPPEGTIERGRLLDLLTERPGSQLVSLIAPPGYGKTTLLAQWAAREERPLAWLTLDALDNDPAVLLSYLATALDRVYPIEATIKPGLARAGRGVLATAVPRLVSELHRWPRGGVLVLDDAHRLTDRTCLDALAAILDHLPRGLRVAVAGRSEPELPIARLRAQRKLLEIGPVQLALDEEETAQLTAAAGHRLSPKEVRAMLARTEGWATGIYLSLLARGRKSGAVGPIEVSGGERHIASYLRSEFEQGLDEEDLDFLTRSAVLERIEPPVAEVVAHVPNAAERLRRLSAGNLLIQRIGPDETTYRYHNLLRDFLATELERREPGATPLLHRRAAAWYYDAGDADLAVEHALAGSDMDMAARYVTGLALQAVQQGHSATVYRWLQAFDTAALRRYPPLAVIASWIYLLTGRPEDADHAADVAEEAGFDGAPADGSASFTSQRAMLRSIMGRNGPRMVITDAQLAVSQERPDSPWRTNALMCLGAGHLLLGEVDRADEAYAAAVQAGGSSARVATMVALAKRASIRIRRRDWDGAEAFLSQARDRLDHGHYEDIVASLIVHAVGARIAINRGDQEKGREDLVAAQFVRPLTSHAIPWFSVDALLELARAYLAIADPAGAQMVLREAEAIVRRRPALGALIDELLVVRRQLSGASATLVGSSALTSAELRVLPLLPTYLSFQEIADRLMISRNTVKTHAMSIYGKLWASSRSEAVERAVELGLLEPFPILASTNGDAPPAGSSPIE
jgi:LuxR family transcriptional regulator, maltose regulon positive regulatory protein